MVNYVLKMFENDRIFDLVSIECQVMENLYMEEVGDDDVVFEERYQLVFKEDKKVQKWLCNDSVGNNDMCYVLKKIYKIELGKLIEDVIMFFMFDLYLFDRVNNYFVYMNGLWQCLYCLYISGLELDISDI